MAAGSSGPAKDELISAVNRALDRGVLLDADIIIGVAGVPLIGLRLKAALAGVETMQAYGLFPATEMAVPAALNKGGTATKNVEARKPLGPENEPERAQQPGRGPARRTDPARAAGIGGGRNAPGTCRAAGPTVGGRAGSPGSPGRVDSPVAREAAADSMQAQVAQVRKRAVVGDAAGVDGGAGERSAVTCCRCRSEADSVPVSRT